MRDAGGRSRAGAGGKATLDWQSYPPFGHGTVEALAADDAPDGDGGVGVLKHPGDGGATISHADVIEAEGTFEIEVSIFCPLDGDDRMGSLTGIAFCLPTGENEAAAEDHGFYRLVCDYRFGDAGISLAYVGANIDRKQLDQVHAGMLGVEGAGQHMQPMAPQLDRDGRTM